MPKSKKLERPLTTRTSKTRLTQIVSNIEAYFQVLTPINPYTLVPHELNQAEEEIGNIKERIGNIKNESKLLRAKVDEEVGGKK